MLYRFMKGWTRLRSASTLTASTTKLRSLYLSYIRWTMGSSNRHGPHQVAHTFSRMTFPFNCERRMEPPSAPAISRSGKTGRASCCASAAGAPASRARLKRNDCISPPNGFPATNIPPFPARDQGPRRLRDRSTAMSPPPIFARVWRGDRVESVHRGSVAVVDEDGRLIAGAGAPRGGIYLRSAAKPFQAMPLLEAEGDRAFRLGRDEIALLCASHGGEPRHVRVAARILDRGGFSTADLACGADMPMHEPSARALLAAGQRPTALHNNCSGKHAGLHLACRLYGFGPAGYWKPRHPLQRLIRKRLGDFIGVPVARIGFAVD